MLICTWIQETWLKTDENFDKTKAILTKEKKTNQQKRQQDYLNKARALWQWQYDIYTLSHIAPTEASHDKTYFLTKLKDDKLLQWPDTIQLGLEKLTNDSFIIEDPRLSTKKWNRENIQKSFQLNIFGGGLIHSFFHKQLFTLESVKINLARTVSKD